MSEVLELLDTFEVIKRNRGPKLVSSVLESCTFHESVQHAEQSQVQRVMGTISKALSGSSKGGKLSGLKTLDMVLGQINQETLLSTGLKLIQQVAKVVSRPGESLDVLTSGYRCLDTLVRLTVNHSDICREVSGLISGLVSGCLACHQPSASIPFLSCLMQLYPGSCGHARHHVENALATYIGKGQIEAALIGKCFGLIPQVGGGGKEGVDHQRMWSVTFNKLMATATQVLDQLFEHVKEFDRPQVGGVQKLQLDEAAGSALEKAYCEQRQVCDLLACMERMLKDPFPQLKAIPVEDILSLCSRILAVTPASLAKSQMQELTVLSAVVPHLHLSSLKVVSSLVTACRDELLPVAADINNIIVDGLKVAKVSEVRRGVYSLMTTWCQVVGPACSLDICAQQILELAVHDIIPPKQKILLTSKTESTKKNKKGGGYHQKASRPSPASNSGLSPSTCSAALSGLESLLQACGPYIRPELHKDLSCVVVSQCLEQPMPPPYNSPSCQTALYSCLTALILHSSPKFPSPARLALPVLTSASRHHHLGVSAAAGRGLAALMAMVHPRCPSLAVPVLAEEQIVKIVASVINGKVEEEEGGEGEVVGESDEMECQEVVMEEMTTGKSNVPGDLIQDIIKAKASIRNALQRGDLDKKLENENPGKQAVAVKRASADALEMELVKRSKFEDNLKNIESDNEPDNDCIQNVEDNDDIENSKTVSSNTIEGQPKEIINNSKSGNTSIAANDEPSGTEKADEELDVDTMLKDFSDKLNKNLQPDPWQSDEDSS